jgi:hypothetical protein
MTNFRFKAPIACQIANLDRSQLNEAIARGFYDCAPPTAKGSVRYFGLYDMVILTVFGQLIRLGLSLKDASRLVSLLYGNAHTKGETLGTFLVTIPDLGSPQFEKIDRNGPIPATSGRGKVRFALFIDLDTIRADIVERGSWEQANPIIGDDD